MSNYRSFRSWRSQRTLLRLPVVAGASLVTLACADGYPTVDMPLPTPASMTQQQRIEVLNHLGAESDPDKRWQYRLHPGCRLEIKIRGDTREQMDIPLEGARVGSDYADGSQTYRIQILPEGRSRSAPITVFESDKWTDNVYVRALLTQLELGCTEAAAPPP
ncbi:hypothetical protein [Caldimonas tepidiphila]|uniref:hypothetical protein n=1 Tax=Caldimonas tepidiphila TaxID=2315841 RepID=UPI000E5AB098|nr:hypothetical protein [Caldimonas tepidiphila]